MKITLQESALKDLKKLDRSTADKILLRIQNLEDYPDLANIKKLKNHYPPLRYRIGDYRALFDIENNTLIVVRILHRKDAY